MRAPFGKRLNALVAVVQLAFDVVGDQLDREEVADTAQLGVAFEGAEVGEGHAGFELVEALLRHLAILHELRIALEDGFREEFAAGNLDTELPLEAEDDVQEVDGL